MRYYYGVRTATSFRNIYPVLIALLLVFSLSVPVFAQAANNEVRERDKPADAAELASIAERGRAIAAYDAVAWHATDAVQALHPKEGLVQMYLGQQTSTGWVVAFGRLNEAKDSFLLAFETTPTGDIKQPKVTVNSPPVEDQGQWLEEARAYDLARTAFKPQVRPYNGTVLPAPQGGWYVYFYPAQTTIESFPAGADIRYRISHDGTKIEETHRMHVSLMEYKVPTGTKPVMVVRTAILDDAPEDTDVANVLMMGGMPVMITGHNFTYKIGEDGTPVYLMKTSDLLKTIKK